MRPAPIRRLGSVAAAAAYLDVNPKTIRRHIAAGIITGYRVGPRLLKVDFNELEAAAVREIPTAGGGDHDHAD